MLFCKQDIIYLMETVKIIQLHLIGIIKYEITPNPVAVA